MCSVYVIFYLAIAIADEVSFWWCMFVGLFVSKFMRKQ